MSQKISKDLALELWKKKKYFSKGKRGLIFVSEKKEKKFVIKTKNPKSTATNIIKREYENNLLLNSIGVGPKIFYFDHEEEFLIREFVDGVPFFVWIKNSSPKKTRFFLMKLLLQCNFMDLVGINKLELNRPSKDLLVVQDLPVLIDFERCKKSLKPKNVTQFCQFLTSKNLEKILVSKNINFCKDAILDLAEQYKYALIKKNVDTQKQTILKLKNIILGAK